MNFCNPISSILKKELVTVHPNTLAEDVKHLFNEKSFHHLPVVNDYGNLLGIISKLDLFRMEKLLEKRPSTWPALDAKDFMTKHPQFLSPSDELQTAAHIFLENKIHALPIVKDKIVIGIITAHDLLALLLKIPYALVEDDDLEFDPV